MCVLCCQKRSTVAVCDECKEHYCTACIDTHTCGTNVMMQIYCSRYLNNAYRFYWRCGCAILTPHSPNLLRC